MPLDLHRIDDRLIHGQVVVGWGQPLELRTIVLVDDEVAGSEWEQDLYRMGVPPDMTVVFCTVEQAIARHAEFVRDPRHALLLTGDIDTMARLCAGIPAIRRVNVGGIHHKPGRHQRLRYVFLTTDEERALRAIAARGVEVTAQDLPAARPVPLEEFLGGTTSS